MQIVINATSGQKEEWLTKPVPATVTLHWYAGTGPVPAADAYFDLLFEETGEAFVANNKPLFVHAVVADASALPAGSVRINAWKGFLQRSVMEIAGTEEALAAARPVLEAMQWQYQVTPSKPGMIAARILAMIINEAYYGLGDELASKEGIDTAMKLGTNYPNGPFEWAAQIGLHQIAALLQALEKEESRYAVAPALLASLNQSSY